MEAGSRVKKTEALQSALQKFDLCPNGLTVPELKSIVMAATMSSDSPVKKKKEELQQQLYREPRYSRAKQLAQDVRRTLDSDAAATLISLFAPESNPSATGTSTEAPALTEV